MSLPRKYDKGEKRWKHVGRTPIPEIEFDKHQPRMFVGKCPTGISDSMRSQLLADAISTSTGDREIDYPKYLYVVHEGAVYEARTSDAGGSYHGFPYRGRIDSDVLEKLRLMAQKKQCLDAFERWVKDHITL